MKAAPFFEADQAALDGTAPIRVHLTGGTSRTRPIPAMIPALSLRPQGRLKLGPSSVAAMLLHVATVGQVPGIQGLAGMAAGPTTRSDGDAG